MTEKHIKPITGNEPLKRVRRTKEELKDVYIDPLEMEGLIVEYYACPDNVISERLAAMIQMIAVRLGLARNFYSYSFKTEMQGDAIVKMMTALRRKRFTMLFKIALKNRRRILILYVDIKKKYMRITYVLGKFLAKKIHTILLMEIIQLRDFLEISL
jgi:hypothetical protein